MKKKLSLLLSVIFALVLILASPALRAYAYSEVDCFDFGDATLSIEAGGSKQMWFRTEYDYTYYIEGATSSATYLECSFGAGSQYVTFHIGPDEQGKNVFFHFYVTDERLQTEDKHYCVEVYVQNIKATDAAVVAPIAGGRNGSLVQTGNVSMLYNQAGVAMASFSLGTGNGVMTSYKQQGIVSNAGANYFTVTASDGNASPKISDSDKAVMSANGYAGVCVNGAFKNWP